MIDDILNDDWSMVDDELEELDVSILSETDPFELMCQHKDYQPNQIHHLFVYGTMKRGYPNHGRITARPGNKFISEVITLAGNFIMGTRKSSRGLVVPIINSVGLGNYNIIGELYEIDGPTLLSIDLAEGYPNIYTRERVTTFAKGTLAGAQVYVYTEDFTVDPDDENIVVTLGSDDDLKGYQRFRCEKYER